MKVNLKYLAVYLALGFSSAIYAADCTDGQLTRSQSARNDAYGYGNILTTAQTSCNQEPNCVKRYEGIKNNYQTLENNFKGRGIFNEMNAESCKGVARTFDATRKDYDDNYSYTDSIFNRYKPYFN